MPLPPANSEERAGSVGGMRSEAELRQLIMLLEKHLPEMPPALLVVSQSYICFLQYVLGEHSMMADFFGDIMLPLLCGNAPPNGMTLVELSNLGMQEIQKLQSRQRQTTDPETPAGGKTN